MEDEVRPSLRLKIFFRGAIVCLLAYVFHVHAERNLSIQPAKAGEGGRRVALVIGNGSYKDSPLRNPPNDAEDMAAALREVGFDVILRKEANQRDIKAAIREFGQKARGAEAGLFFFAGHGLQVKGVNYLVPTATNIQSEPEAEDQAVSLDLVMRTMEESGAKFNIAILDACRNNPFARSFRSGTRGLAQTQAATGTLIAYATAPGSVAADGDGRNGVYTKHLLKNIREADGDILRVFQRVRTGVVEETRRKQTPWESISLVGDFYFKQPGTTVRPATQALATPASPSEPVSASGAAAVSGPSVAETLDYINRNWRYEDKRLAPATVRFYIEADYLVMEATGKGDNADSKQAALVSSLLQDSGASGPYLTCRTNSNCVTDTSIWKTGKLNYRERQPFFSMASLVVDPEMKRRLRNAFEHLLLRYPVEAPQWRAAEQAKKQAALDDEKRRKQAELEPLRARHGEDAFSR